MRVHIQQQTLLIEQTSIPHAIYSLDRLQIGCLCNSWQRDDIVLQLKEQPVVLAPFTPWLAFTTSFGKIKLLILWLMVKNL